MTDSLSFFLPITKVDATQRLVYGVAASQAFDKSKERFHYDTSKANFEKWSGDIAKATDGKSLGNVREMHQPKAAGKVTDLDFDDVTKTIAICTKCVDEDTWRKIEEGVLTGFSIGGKYEKRWSDPQEPGVKWYTALPTEVSYVDNPCNPDAVFQMVKADGVVEDRHFAESVHTPSAQPGEGEGEAATVQKDAGGEAAGDTAIADALAAAELAKSKDIATPDPAAAIGADPVQRWIAKDGSHHEKKDGALKKNAAIDAGAAADAASAEAMTLIGQIEGKLGKGGDDAGDGSKPYGDVEYADQGYQKDGKKRYPLDTEKHIRAAWNYIHKAKNADKYSADQVSKIKAKIVSAWKATIDKEGPPEADAAKKAAGVANLAKSLYDVGTVADLICTVDWMAENLKWEAMVEGDNSATPAKAREACGVLCDLLRAIVAEETAEVMSGSEIDDDDLAEAAKAIGTDIGKVNAALAASHPEFVARFEKAAAGNATVDTGKAGTHAAPQDGTAVDGDGDDDAPGKKKVTKDDGGEDGGEGDMAMAAGAGDLAKMTDELAKTQGLLDAEKARTEALSKVVDTVTTKLGDIAERLAKVEAEPAPALTAGAGAAHLPAGVHAVDKVADGGGQMTKTAPSEAELADALAKMDPEARAAVLTKAALRNPIPVPGLGAFFEPQG